MARYALFLALSSWASASQLPLVENTIGQTLAATTKPLVTTESLQARIKPQFLLERAKQLSKIADLSIEEYNHPTRVIGSRGHIGTLDYIYSNIESLDGYYLISNQTFDVMVGNVFESRLVIGDREPESSSPMSLTPATKNKHPVFGPLVLISNEGCDVSDYPVNTTGAIALIKRGTCAFSDKSAAAGKAGAIAAVIYNNGRGGFSGTLGEPSKYHVATFGISNDEAAPYIKNLSAGESIDASAYVDAVVKKTGTTNIIAQTRGGGQDNCVMLGGHSDSVSEGPGINDDGTGSLTLLEIAIHLSNYTVNNCVRFAWWAGEEEGLLGSDYYVSQLSKEENLKIRLFMDFDMLASPNYAYQVYNATDALNPLGSEQLKNLFADYYEFHGLNHTYIPFDGRSDYDAFIKNGIPGGGIATGAEGVKTKKEAEMFGGTAGDWFDPCYHQICDTINNLNLEAWEWNTKLIAHSVAHYAVSFKGFPERKTVTADVKVERSLYHGPKLVL